MRIVHHNISILLVKITILSRSSLVRRVCATLSGLVGLSDCIFTTSSGVNRNLCLGRTGSFQLFNCSICSIVSNSAKATNRGYSSNSTPMNLSTTSTLWPNLNSFLRSLVFYVALNELVNLKRFPAEWWILELQLEHQGVEVWMSFGQMQGCEWSHLFRHQNFKRVRTT